MKTQIEVVNEYIRGQNKVHEARGEEPEGLLPENCVLTREQSAIHGERLQRMFLDHINQHLLNERGLYAEISSEEERSTPERKRMNRQAILAKSERDFNYMSRQVEEKQKDLNHLRNELFQEAKSIELIQAQKEQLIAQLADIDSTFQSEKLKQQEELEQAKQEIRALNIEGIRLSNVTKKLSGTADEQLVSIIRQAYIAVQYQKRGQHQKANDYFNQLTQRLDNEMDLGIKPIFQSAIDAIKGADPDNSNNNEVDYD